MTGIAGPFLCIPESLMRSLANSCAAFSARNPLYRRCGPNPKEAAHMSQVVASSRALLHLLHPDTQGHRRQPRNPPPFEPAVCSSSLPRVVAARCTVLRQTGPTAAASLIVSPIQLSSSGSNCTQALLQTR